MGYFTVCVMIRRRPCLHATYLASSSIRPPLSDYARRLVDAGCVCELSTASEHKTHAQHLFAALRLDAVEKSHKLGLYGLAQPQTRKLPQKNAPSPIGQQPS